VLPEKIASLLEQEDFKKLSHKLAEIVDTDYLYSRNKTELMLVVAEIIEKAYKKGRMDESYYNGGPLFSLYEKPE
jgi:hypothetical protein